MQRIWSGQNLCSFYCFFLTELNLKKNNVYFSICHKECWIWVRVLRLASAKRVQFAFNLFIVYYIFLKEKIQLFFWRRFNTIFFFVVLMWMYNYCIVFAVHSVPNWLGTLNRFFFHIIYYTYIYLYINVVMCWTCRCWVPSDPWLLVVHSRSFTKINKQTDTMLKRHNIDFRS